MVSIQNIVNLIILIILIALSSFFSSAETAMTTVNKIRIQALAEEGNKKAQTCLKVLEERAKMLNAILIGNNLVNISATALTTSVAIGLFGSAAVGAATGIMTVLIIMFGEITPKTMASVNAEKMALNDAGVIRFLMIILTPLIFILNKLSRGLIRLLGVDPDAKVVMTETELRTLVDVSEEDGVIEKDEHRMINNVVDLSDTYAKEIMIPRIDMTEVPLTSTYDELIETFREHHFTRLPVYQDRSENIVGVLNIKDLLLAEKENFKLADTMKTPYFTYEMKNISDLLDEMRLQTVNIVIVLDEYGQASGMLTLEDVLEEIVGDIQDEYRGRDVEEITEIVPGKEYSLLGSVSIDDFNQEAGLNLESEDYDSIGGYVIEHSEDRLPKVGEFVMLPDGTKLVVEAVRKNRIMRVHAYLPDPVETEKGKEKSETKEKRS